MNIQEFFQKVPVCAVAFSGGVDSAWLLHEAVHFANRTAAYFINTPFQPAFALADAQEIAHRLGADLRVLELEALTVPEVAKNPPDRCYYCKKNLFTHLIAAAEADGFPVVLDGSNASDDADDRPGMRALRELGVHSPLRECGLVKSDIRRLAEQAGIHVWNKPSYACLATRIPTGTPITAEALRRVEQGESTLMALGFSDFRLRLRGEGALLQVRPEQMDLARHRLAEINRLLAEDFAETRLDPTPRITREI